MTIENAMRWYHWNPFTHISREQATVGALRKAPKAMTSPTGRCPSTTMAARTSPNSRERQGVDRQ
jgi:hypothetical protein